MNILKDPSKRHKFYKSYISQFLIKRSLEMIIYNQENLDVMK